MNPSRCLLAEHYVYTETVRLHSAAADPLGHFLCDRRAPVPRPLYCICHTLQILLTALNTILPSAVKKSQRLVLVTSQTSRLLSV